MGVWRKETWDGVEGLRKVVREKREGMGEDVEGKRRVDGCGVVEREE